MGIINPADVTFVINNQDGTSTVGVTENGQSRNEIVSRREGNELAAALEKRQSQNAALERKIGSPPPAYSVQERIRQINQGKSTHSVVGKKKGGGLK